MKASSLFSEQSNCWRISQASHMCPLIDCANYYTALYHAIINARRSIFIAGWDIDSRIDLLRGNEAKAANTPSNICELLAWKAKQIPDLQIFLLRWDSSLAFFGSREHWAKEVWDDNTPENVHVWLDDTIPMGGCQHQKVVVIDDELAFSGGMDVATHRWDTREHLADDERRIDEEGTYGPLHDVQVMVSGPIVQELGKLLRWRWLRATGREAIASQPPAKLDQLPQSWPQQFESKIQHMPCAVSRTIPFMDDAKPVQEVRHMMLDLIARAEKFLYIENQFASRQEIAEALNQQLLAKPDLQVLIVSSCAPKSTMESEAYWAGRIDFKRILEQGVSPDRVQIVHSMMEDSDANPVLKRVHAKVMVVDDQWLVIGSSNLTNRSMSLDTECDLVFAADTPTQQAGLRELRNDLLAEHTGLSMAEVAEVMDQKNPLSDLLHCHNKNRYHLLEVNDREYTDQSWQELLTPVSDPEEPLLPPIPAPGGKRFHLPNPRRKTLLLLTIAAVFSLLAGSVLAATYYFDWFNSENLNGFLEASRNNGSALPTVLLIYVVGGFLFFPVTVMSLAVAAVFGPLWGPIYGLAGALASATIMFLCGNKLGDNGVRRLGGPWIRKLDNKFTNSGITGVAVLRLLPVAPYSLVNLVAGISSISLLPFLAGTFLGMLPPMIAKGFVGDSLSKIAMNPSPETITYLALGLLVWAGVVILCQKLARRLQNDNATIDSPAT